MSFMVDDMRTDNTFGPMSEEQADEMIRLAEGTLREGAYVKVPTENWAHYKGLA